MSILIGQKWCEMPKFKNWRKMPKLKIICDIFSNFQSLCFSVFVKICLSKKSWDEKIEIRDNNKICEMEKKILVKCGIVWKPQFDIFLAFTMRSKLSRVSCSLSPMSPVYYGFMLKRAALKISQDFARRMRHHHDGLSTRSKITGLESKFFPISPTLITKVFGVKLNKSNL